MDDLGKQASKKKMSAGTGNVRFSMYLYIDVFLNCLCQLRAGEEQIWVQAQVQALAQV